MRIGFGSEHLRQLSCVSFGSCKPAAGYVAAAFSVHETPVKPSLGSTTSKLKEQVFERPTWGVGVDPRHGVLFDANRCKSIFILRGCAHNSE